MQLKSFTKFSCIALLLTMLTFQGIAQKWSGVNGNEWLEGKYGQSWVRIGVSAKGMYRVPVSSLPANFQSADKSKLQLWHRGAQVALIKADNDEVVFYGVPNMGESDELLYRLSSSRKNPYYSLFSDIGVYFLTIGSENGSRAAVENTAVDAGVAATTTHTKVDVKTYQNEFTHTTIYAARPTTLNSYFEEGKTGTGSRMPFAGANLNTIHVSNPKPTAYANSYVPVPFSFQVKLAQSNPVVKVLLHGRSGNANAQIHVGASAASLRQATTLATADFLPAETSFEITSADYDANGNGTLGFRGTVFQNFFSVSYFSLTYQQEVNMQGASSYEFSFPATSAGSKSRIVVNSPTGTPVFYDISKPDQPRIIQGAAANLMVTRDSDPLTLLAISAAPATVTSANISSVTFQDINPANYDYLIVTNETLALKAQTYANYRQSVSPGKKYRPIVIKITDLYNQFNYGEASPVGIRRFVDFMISDNVLNKYLLLMGKSITRPDFRVRELPDEVPTIGFPGSDILLTDGLRNTPDDVPAIPVGRISATSPGQIDDYLEKLAAYEKQTDIAWRRNVMHISGGKYLEEANIFKTYLETIAPSVTATGVPGNPGFGGKVYQRFKGPAASDFPPDGTEIKEITIKDELNGVAPGISGLGMITYFGHGSTYRTDLNAGYATDAAKGYNNTGKYPVLFYNGCGVGNIFSNTFAETVNASTSRPLSLDWLLAKNKGAIVVFGNDWDAYASNSNEYLDRLYPYIFKNDAKRGTIGQILKDVAAQTKTAKGYTYNVADNSRVMAYYDADRANIHQIMLQGDPALKILVNESPLPVELVSFDAKVNGDKVDITWKTASERNNSHFIVERSYNAKNFEVIGQVEGKGDSETESFYSIIDNDPLDGKSYYRLKQVDRDATVAGQVVEGTATYSRMIAVNRPNTSLLVVSPNPTTDVVELNLKAPVEMTTWRLIDAAGRVTKQGSKTNKIVVTDLPSGTYIVEVKTANGDVYTKKISKR